MAAVVNNEKMLSDKEKIELLKVLPNITPAVESKRKIAKGN